MGSHEDGNEERLPKAKKKDAFDTEKLRDYTKSVEIGESQLDITWSVSRLMMRSHAEEYKHT
jgi:hypothetical protein